MIAPPEDLAVSEDISRALRFPLASQFDTGHSRLVATSKSKGRTISQESYIAHRANVCVRYAIEKRSLARWRTPEGGDIADCICVSSRTSSVSSKLQITARGCMCRIERQERQQAARRGRHQGTGLAFRGSRVVQVTTR